MYLRVLRTFRMYLRVFLGLAKISGVCLDLLCAKAGELGWG